MDSNKKRMENFLPDIVDEQDSTPTYRVEDLENYTRKLKKENGIECAIIMTGTNDLREGKKASDIHKTISTNAEKTLKPQYRHNSNCTTSNNNHN